MASQMEANEQMKNQVQRYKSLPCTTNTQSRHEFVYKPPSIRNENDKGDVKFIKEDEIKPIPTTPNPNPIMSSSPTIPPFLKDSTMHILYMNVKMFADDVFLNHIVDKEIKSIDGIRTGRMTKKEKDDVGMPKEPNQE
nr:hypothetical protein [Tanacetum cinerariifolium]